MDVTDCYCGNQLSPSSSRYGSQPPYVCWKNMHQTTLTTPFLHLRTDRFSRQSRHESAQRGHQSAADNGHTCGREEKRAGYLQQLVTAKLFATSRLSMWGVSLNSEVPNWTIPIRNALYSWSAPLGKSPPEIEIEIGSELQCCVTFDTLTICLLCFNHESRWSLKLMDTYQSEHWASLQARTPIKPAAPKWIDSLSFPCPQFSCPHPPGKSDIPNSLRWC